VGHLGWKPVGVRTLSLKSFLVAQELQVGLEDGQSLRQLGRRVVLGIWVLFVVSSSELGDDAMILSLRLKLVEQDFLRPLCGLVLRQQRLPQVRGLHLFRLARGARRVLTVAAQRRWEFTQVQADAGRRLPLLVQRPLTPLARRLLQNASLLTDLWQRALDTKVVLFLCYLNYRRK